MIKIRFVVLVIAALAMAGCSNTIAPSINTQEPTLTTVTNANNTATSVDIPTATPIPTSLSTIYPTNTAGIESGISCFKVQVGEMPLQNLATGTIVLEKGAFPYQTFLLDLKSSNEYKLPSQSKQVVYFGFQVSPDQNMLAYLEGLQNSAGQFDKMVFWLVNARAEVLQKITFNMPGLYNLLWLDNQNIIFYTDQTSKDGTVMIFNPFTHEQRYISNDLPDFYTESQLLPGLSWLIEYSPDLKWGIYLGSVKAGKLGFLIRDFVHGQTIWQIADAVGEYQKPVWSPNGDAVAVIASGHLYLINHNGTAKPIQVINEYQQTQVSKASWSPDGRYLAFWNFSELTIYDIKSDQLIDLCVKNEYPDYPIWSSDSQKLAVSAYLNEGGVLVDLQNEVVYKLLTITDTSYPSVWMNSMP